MERGYDRKEEQQLVNAAFTPFRAQRGRKRRLRHREEDKVDEFCVVAGGGKGGDLNQPLRDDDAETIHTKEARF